MRDTSTRSSFDLGLSGSRGRRLQSLDNGSYEGPEIFGVFTRQQQHTSRRHPPIFPFNLFGKDRMRNDCDLWHSTVQFEETAWHVVPSRDQPQAFKTLLSHPLCGLSRIAEGIVCVVA